ncbi:MAG: DUF1592 domain-containing protein [Myxococcota bacterium]
MPTGLGCYGGTADHAAADSGGEDSGGEDSSGGGIDDRPSSEHDVGRIALHRLTRAEYENTLADLFGGTFADADFIRGGTGVGFANEADLLRDISDDLAEGYIEHAQDVAEQVFADPALRSRVTDCVPVDDSDTACAVEMIESFGLAAWRRPLTPEEISRLEGRYVDARSFGATHDGALEHLVRMFLSSPNFVFHIELDPDPNDPTPHRLGAFELANRLSYTLWSSLPDDELRSLAASDALHDDEVLLAQVDRMLDDPRAERFQRGFLHDWVHLPLLDSKALSVDTEVYPQWSAALGQDMRAEIEAYLREFTDAELPWSSFLTADINYVTPLLAAHYGMEPPAGGEQLVRVDNYPDSRVGYLGLAGFLTYTSRADRTAPTLRGKIVLESLQCTTLAIPPDVPELDESDEGGETEFPTIRERLEEHRKSPECAGCHVLLDPIGLSLENYDAIGAWRDHYRNDYEIDAAVDYRGQPIEGLIELAEQVSLEPGFMRCPSEKVLSYALRRPPQGDDREFAEEISEDWGVGSIRDLVKLVVTSDAFRFRRGISQAEED